MDAVPDVYTLSNLYAISNDDTRADQHFDADPEGHTDVHLDTSPFESPDLRSMNWRPGRA
jgi:hypothetical protein